MQDAVFIKMKVQTGEVLHSLLYWKNSMFFKNSLGQSSAPRLWTAIGFEFWQELLWSQLALIFGPCTKGLSECSICPID